MAKKKGKKAADIVTPKFPYTTEPKSLRRLLAEIPKRPKPAKINMDTIRSWGVSNNNNAATAIRVLKAIGLLGASGEPTPAYADFMKTGTGPSVLAAHIKSTYKVLFDNALAPQNESEEELRKLLNIHSGGGEDTMRLQLQTFKALCAYADFRAEPGAGDAAKIVGLGATPPAGGKGGDHQHLPPVQVDLHIHLPENKTTRDYEAIIQDIARYIYGRDVEKA
jgi:uncharacterized protein DUF5343